MLAAAAALLCSFACHSPKSADGFLPAAPDYSIDSLWVRVQGDSLGTGADVFYVVSTWEVDWQTPDGQTCHYADVYNPLHQSHMHIEQKGVAAYMGASNNFYAPLYRHATIDNFITRDEDLIAGRFLSVSMPDVQTAFDWFLAHRDPSRPLVLAGFSQGAMATVQLIKSMDDETYRHLVAAYVLGYKITPSDTLECPRFRPAQGATDTGVTICYNTVKDTAFIVDIISQPNVMCINPVNWSTGPEPALLHDTITISLDTLHHVLVAQNYAATEYRPYKDFINVGDIHGCEPWLYSRCLRRNISDRVRAWREKNP